MALLSIAQIERISRNASENLIFFSPAILLAVAMDKSERYSEDCKLECLAELIVRWYLNPSSDLEKSFDEIFPQKEWHSLKKIKEREIFAIPTASGLPGKLWECPTSFFVRCEVATRKKLAKMLDADGFIPVYSGSEAFFLPFFLEENSQKNLICDAANIPIENWQEPYQILFGDSPQYRCTILCRKTEYLPPLVGHSLMLPLYLAYNRKRGVLPPYNRLRLLSTGAIEHGHLKAVETEEKRKALGLCFQNASLFFPESSKIHSEEWNSVPLNITMTLDEILEEIRKQIEAKGLVIPTFLDAKRRLENLDYETRHTSQNRWEIMIARLQTNMDAIQLSRDRDPESYLLCLMLKSAMYCHMGSTTRALEYNEEAKKEARNLNLEKHLRRLEIEELVELQDFEAFDSINSLAKTLKEDIERLNDDDLLMRYYGTMGQAHCYGALAGVSGFDKDTAKSYFAKAVQHAQKLNSEQDIAQDLNYSYQWYSLFEPDSDGAAFAYNRANDHIERNLQAYPQSQKKNRYFLQRLKMQSLYRQILSGKKIPALDYQREILPDDAPFWLRALVKKYVAAIAAANGDQELSARYFQYAFSLVKRDYGDNIIAFIRMTILTETYRSLNDEVSKQAALDSFSELSAKYGKELKPWQDYLLCNAKYPGLHYWY